MKFQTLASEAESKLTVKGSKFLGFARPVGSTEDIERILLELKKRYYDASHHCYAWQLGTGGETRFRCSDDGEPSGTAGKPIHAAITRRDLTDVLVVSVRYFGGTKLGTGGLARAYGQSASDTLDAAKILCCEKGDTIRFVCSYELHPLILRAINAYHVISLDQDFGEQVTVDTEVDERHTRSLLEEVKNATSGSVEGIIL